MGPVMALQNLGLEVNHVFSCDVNKHAKATIMANFPPKIFFDDLTKRDNTKAPTADLYVAGFPCQPFSTAGLQQGFSDARGRGEIFWHVRDYLEQKKPRVFVLENVSGLVKIKGGEYYRAILEALDALNTYNVYSRIQLRQKRTMMEMSPCWRRIQQSRKRRKRRGRMMSELWRRNQRRRER